jgi:ABC-type transporter Mla subunit MlaD
MIAENRGPVRSAVQAWNATFQKLDPLLQDLRANSTRVNETLDHLDSLVGENRADARQAVIDLRQSLANVNALTERLDQTLESTPRTSTTCWRTFAT